MELRKTQLAAAVGAALLAGVAQAQTVSPAQPVTVQLYGHVNRAMMFADNETASKWFFVDGQPSKPLVEKGWLLVPLPRSRDRDTPFLVSVIYETEVESLGDGGKGTVEVARPLLLIDVLKTTYTLHLPQGYRLTGHDGDLVPLGRERRETVLGDLADLVTWTGGAAGEPEVRLDHRPEPVQVGGLTPAAGPVEDEERGVVAKDAVQLGPGRRKLLAEGGRHRRHRPVAPPLLGRRLIPIPPEDEGDDLGAIPELGQEPTQEIVLEKAVGVAESGLLGVQDDQLHVAEEEEVERGGSAPGRQVEHDPPRVEPDQGPDEVQLPVPDRVHGRHHVEGARHVPQAVDAGRLGDGVEVRCAAVQEVPQLGPGEGLAEEQVQVGAAEVQVHRHDAVGEGLAAGQGQGQVGGDERFADPALSPAHRHHDGPRAGFSHGGSSFVRTV